MNLFANHTSPPSTRNIAAKIKVIFMTFQNAKMSPQELLVKLEAGENIKIDGWSISRTDLSFGSIIETTNPYGCGSGTSSMTVDDCTRLIDQIDFFNEREQREYASFKKSQEVMCNYAN